MLTQDRRVFLHEEYLVKHLSSSERVLNQYQYVHALVSRGLNNGIRSYASAPRSIIGTPLPAGFALILLFVLRNYTEVETDWRANSEGLERAILQNRLRRFELAVVWA